MRKSLRKKAQEEMVGFAMIMIIVGVILLIFIGFSLRSPQKETVESYEVESFVQASLQYTTDCVDGYEPQYYSIGGLITACSSGEKCLDGRDTCDALNSTLSGIIESSWPSGENYPVKGYELNITSDTGEIMSIKKGNETSSSKGAVQYFKGDDIYFTAYY